MQDNNIIQRLKTKITKNVEKNNKVDQNNQEDNELLGDALKHIAQADSEVVKLRDTIKALNSEPLSTTQFFNPSLAKDFYNMNGNSLQTNSYLAVRQMLGICNNNTPGVMQTIPGVNTNTPNGSTPNGTAVGLASTLKAQAGGGLGTMILNRINYFQNMFEIECSDKKLKQAIYRYLMDVVLSGYAVIEKQGDKYLNGCANNVELNSDGSLKSFEAYNSAFIINEIVKHYDEKDFGLTKVNSDNYVGGKGRSNGYNIWYYVMCYLMNSVDLLYIFGNRARLNKTVVIQKKGNDSTAIIEAQNFVDPYQNVVTVNTVGVLDNMDDKPEDIKLENMYSIEDLGNGEQTQYSFTNFALGNDYGDNEVGLRSMPINTNTNRSIANEINPLTIKLSKQQQDFKICLQEMCDQIEDKGGVHVEIKLIDDLLLQSLNPNEFAKGEGGNESEQKFDNGEMQ